MRILTRMVLLWVRPRAVPAATRSVRPRHRDLLRRRRLATLRPGRGVRDPGAYLRHADRVVGELDQETDNGDYASYSSLFQVLSSYMRSGGMPELEGTTATSPGMIPVSWPCTLTSPPATSDVPAPANHVGATHV
jgi:hypothetical protein